jgi:hypothetical protein
MLLAHKTCRQSKEDSMTHNEQATVFIADQQARQKVHDDKLRKAIADAEARKGSPLSAIERQAILKLGF